MAYTGESMMYSFGPWDGWRPPATHLLRICYGSPTKMPRYLRTSTRFVISFNSLHRRG